MYANKKEELTCKDVCMHNNLYSINYSKDMKGQVFLKKQTQVICYDCGLIIFDSANDDCYFHIEDFLDKNKSKIAILNDCTSSDLNYRFHIKSTTEQINLINLLKYTKSLLEKEPISRESILYLELMNQYLDSLERHGEYDDDLVFVPRNWTD